ncbi:hypothetical protein EH240_31290 [Mesorhizobium tamadayense]|uniref:DUF5681 domain-containing protein n=1 Tax=Mesorhizobium tamadayense TaxID=425306 RepID=A0A3P3F0A3_9HYPH|nr:DUF5681 domain-containing protein [Mesorhizobium tamadayense]RRH92070.1 hypothetical protein EH240_31290 [Mesorhizobium tamadayense]
MRNRERGKRKELDGYEVGYGKPPSEHRFAKGQSGNPKGRPKAKKNMKTMVSDTLFAPITIQQNGKTTTVTALEAILLKMRNNALAGDYRSAVQALQLGMRAIEPDEAGQPGAEASPLDPQTMIGLMRDYLDHQPTDGGDSSSDLAADEEE